MSVPYDQSVRLQKALQDARVACELIAVPDGTHGTRTWEDRLPGWADQVVAWLVTRTVEEGR
jgi:acetyl esterase/lipase